MKYIIKGTGGQGVLFIAKTISYALIYSGNKNFTFLKEFDEGQRNGEIKITFTIDSKDIDILRQINENNIIELKKVVKDLNIKDENIEKALKFIKPNAFKKNWEIYNGTN